jgi:hypothetical protein
MYSAVSPFLFRVRFLRPPSVSRHRRGPVLEADVRITVHSIGQGIEKHPGK